MSAPTLVTGATGFVGSAVARVLRDAGHPLRLLARPGSDRALLQGLDAEIVEGDLRDPASLAAAVQGCRYLLHVAADYRLWVPDPGPMMQANVDGTTALLRAARDAGVDRIVYCSSVAALGLIGDGTPGTETTEIHPEKIVGAYKQSKYRAEQAVRALARDEAVPVTIVNPSTPVGPRDIKPTPTGKMVLDAAAGRMPAYVDTGLNVVHVDDVARGHLLALEHGRIGESYILGGEDLDMPHLLAMVDDVVGRPQARRLRLNQAVLTPVALGMEAAARLFKIEPLVTREMLQMAKKRMYLQQRQGPRRAGLRHAPRPPGLRRRHRLVPRTGPPMTALALLAAAIWAYLILLHGRFWSAGPLLPPTAATTTTPVHIVIPARNEEDSIEATLHSLLAQNHPAFHITLVDDQSTDRTAEIARFIQDPRLTIIPGQPRPKGWSGKLWAISQALPSPLPVREAPGVGSRSEHPPSETPNARTEPLILLTDADITHTTQHLATLVNHLESQNLVMASEMVELRCASPAERALVPAFVFFFQLLYPFARVNRPGPTAAAAGGTILLRRDALNRIGGIASLKGALIDDVTLATRLKPLGPIYLGHTHQAQSLRPYPGAIDIWRMVARTRLRPAPLLPPPPPRHRPRPRPRLARPPRPRPPQPRPGPLDRPRNLARLRRHLPPDPPPLPPISRLGARTSRHRHLLPRRHDRLRPRPPPRPRRHLETTRLPGRAGMTLPVETPSVETWSGKGRTDENFPVGSLLIRPALRPHVHAFYDFARNADDIADSPDLAAPDKLHRLATMQSALEHGTGGSPSGLKLRASQAETGVTNRHALDLLAAFRQDATKTRYATWDELLDYCRLSAMPVGRQVLDLHGEPPATHAPSDALCAVLQVLNHLQDGAKDLAALGRCYLPDDQLAAAGAHVQDLAKPAASLGLRTVIDSLLDHCDRLNAEAATLPRLVRDRRLRVECAVITGLARRLAHPPAPQRPRRHPRQAEEARRRRQPPRRHPVRRMIRAACCIVFAATAATPSPAVIPLVRLVRANDPPALLDQLIGWPGPHHRPHRHQPGLCRHRPRRRPAHPKRQHRLHRLRPTARRDRLQPGHARPDRPARHQHGMPAPPGAPTPPRRPRVSAACPPHHPRPLHGRAIRRPPRHGRHLHRRRTRLHPHHRPASNAGPAHDRPRRHPIRPRRRRDHRQARRHVLPPRHEDPPAGPPGRHVRHLRLLPHRRRRRR